MSSSSSSISNLIQNSGFEGSLALTLAYIYEKSLSTDSVWFKYLDSIQQTAQVQENPCLWSLENQDLLAGTEIYYHTLEVNEAHLAEVYKFDLLPFFQDNNLFVDQPEFATFNCFRNSLLLVESRALYVDVYHGLSLVPGACIFNHAQNPDISIQVHRNVCPICGLLDLCKHSISKLLCLQFSNDDQNKETSHYSDKSLEPKETLLAGFSKSLKKDNNQFEINYLPENTSFSDSGLYDSCDDNTIFNCYNKNIKDNIQSYYTNINSCKNTFDLVTTRPILQGKEVFVNYGPLSNHTLARRYGFAVWNNVEETVGLSPEVMEYIANNPDNEKLKRRQVWWSRNFYQAIHGILQTNYQAFIEKKSLGSNPLGTNLSMNILNQAFTLQTGDLPLNPEHVSWEDETYISSTGIPSVGLCKLVYLLSINEDEFELVCRRFEAGIYSLCSTKDHSHTQISRFNNHEKRILKTLIHLRTYRYKDKLSSAQCQHAVNNLKQMQKDLVQLKVQLQKGKPFKYNVTSLDTNTLVDASSLTDKHDLLDSKIQCTRKLILSMTIKGTEKQVLERANCWLTQTQSRKQKYGLVYDEKY